MTQPERPTDSSYLRACRSLAADIGAEAVLAGVLAQLAQHLGRAPHVEGARTCAGLPPLPSDVSVDLLGTVHEALLTDEGRKRSGSFYTPAAIAAGVMRVALTGRDPAEYRHWRICDPAAGGGAFALAAARALHRAGRTRHQVVETQVWAADREPGAAAVTATTLRLWAAKEGPPPEPNVMVGDSLVDGALLVDGMRRGGGERESDDGFDAIVGNPPFLGQLRSGTARTREEAAAIEATLGVEAVGYSDTAALFLLAALRMARPGGRIALILPESILAARDSAAIRARVLEQASLVHLWLAAEPVFSVSARVCVPVLERATPDSAAVGSVSRTVGPSFRAASPVAVDQRSVRGPATWGPLAAGLLGVPEVRLDTAGTLGDWCAATAGFRDQYYGLVPYVIEGRGLVLDEDRYPRLVTRGAIDPACCSWGTRPVRFARRAWVEPRVDLDALAEGDPPLHRWTCERLRPKLVVAAQTKVVEAAADTHGQWYPSTPTVAVEPPPERLWEALAVLLAPPVSAWLLTTLAGTALAADHVRLPAAHIRRIPLPADQAALAVGARLARAASEAPAGERHGHLLALGRVMCGAYGSGDEVFEWWAPRLPPERSTREGISTSA